MKAYSEIASGIKDAKPLPFAVKKVNILSVLSRDGDPSRHREFIVVRGVHYTIVLLLPYADDFERLGTGAMEPALCIEHVHAAITPLRGVVFGYFDASDSTFRIIRKHLSELLGQVEMLDGAEASADFAAALGAGLQYVTTFGKAESDSIFERFGSFLGAVTPIMRPGSADLEA